MKVGFIGLGNMGSGMAANLLKAGHEVTVYNRTPEKAQPLRDRGAAVAGNVPDACRGDAVFTMLSNDEAVESLVFGEEGILRHLARGAVHISSSTISVALAERMAATHVEAGQGFVSAPVFGRPDAAAAGKLFVIAAGSKETVERTTSFLEAIGQKLLVVSERPEVANLVKLSGNFLIASIIEAVGEAMALVAKGGLDPRQFIDILTSVSIFDSPVFKTYGGLIADRKFDPAGFQAHLGLKDVRLALSAAEDLRVPMPVASLLRDRFLALLAQGGEKLDWSAIGQLAAKDAGE
ncbi:MAG: NAD(P)-dependent oxidoreductase [Acidobacteriota bacterium]